MHHERGRAVVATGVPGFDGLVGGGLPADRLYVLCGPPGSGKTTFSAKTIATGVRHGERCLYLTMHETEAQLIADMANYAFDFDRIVRSDRLEFVNVFGDEFNRVFQRGSVNGGSSSVSQVANRLVSHINTRDIDRVVIDSTMLLDVFLADADADLLTFVTSLKQADATVFLISEMTDPTAYEPEHFLAHGVVFFHNFLEDDGMRRGIQVLKLRGVDADTDIHPIRFTDRGIEVAIEEPMAI